MRRTVVLLVIALGTSSLAIADQRSTTRESAKPNAERVLAAKLTTPLREFGVVSYAAPSGAEVTTLTFFHIGTPEGKIRVLIENDLANTVGTLTSNPDKAFSYIAWGADGTQVGPGAQSRPFTVRAEEDGKRMIPIGDPTSGKLTFFPADTHFPSGHSGDQSTPAPSVTVIFQATF